MKKFWNIFKKVMLVLSATAVVVLFVFTLTSAVRLQKSLVCSFVQVRIDYESGLSFLTTDDVTACINRTADGDIVGKPLSSLDFRAIEQGLLREPWIDRAKIYADHSQVLHAEIVQKMPVIRIINNDGVGYYLSDKDEKIPLCGRFTAHVPVAIGDVELHQDVSRDSMVRAQLYSLARYMQQDSLTGAMIDHVYVQPDGGFELYPEFGSHVIEFGRADETMIEKFDKLKTFYREGLAKVGWDRYSLINLKYKGQVVCRKSSTAKEEKQEDKPEDPQK